MIRAQATNADCYSAGERDWMLRGQAMRAWMLGPVLRALHQCKVNANHLTFLSLLAGLAFCPLFFWSPAAALIALLVHVLIDGLDGPLARYTGSASRGGSFTDTMADQIVVMATTTTLMAAHVAGVLPGGLYIFLYTVAVLFAIARNAMAIPYSWMVRPRFFVYAWIAVEIYAFPGTLNLVLWAFNALLTLKVLTGFLRIRKRI
jgi:phosphatidylglycerophosphate synthase